MRIAIRLLFVVTRPVVEPFLSGRYTPCRGHARQQRLDPGAVRAELVRLRASPRKLDAPLRTILTMEASQIAVAAIEAKPVNDRLTDLFPAVGSIQVPSYG